MKQKIFAINDLINFIGQLSFNKTVNYINIQFSFFISRITGRPQHRGMPVSLSIEPTTSCNLRCPECPSGLRQFSRPQGRLSLQGFKDIIDPLKSTLAYLLLYFQGEPFLNTDVVEMIKYASRNKIYTATSTNGHFLNDDQSCSIVESGLDRLIISLDGLDQDTYEKYRRGGELEKVLSGIRDLVKWKKQLRSSKPYIILQFLVFKNNQNQIPAVKKLAREMGVDKLELKTAQVYNFEDDTDLIPDIPKYSRYIKGKDGRWQLKKKIRNRCFRMWSGAVITWDGRVVPCCFDKDAQHQLGTLDGSNFKDIWNSKKYNAFRQQILRDRNSIDICRNCTE